MHRSLAMNILQRQLLSQRSRIPMVNTISQPPQSPPNRPSRRCLIENGRVGCDVFINHRGTDTKRSVASLLYDQLVRLGLRPFLDNKNMKPGDKLFDKINSGIMGCKISVAVFSPRYCESYFCLHELALIMETKKKVIPIFCDVKPSELRVVDNGSCSPTDLKRFSSALEEAKYTVGLTFDSLKGNWSDVVTDAADIVIESLIEIEDEEQNGQYSDH